MLQSIQKLTRKSEKHHSETVFLASAMKLQIRKSPPETSVAVFLVSEELPEVRKIVAETSAMFPEVRTQSM
jgi:hypothetical protein